MPRRGAQKPTAKAIVSTEREFYDPIPECECWSTWRAAWSNTQSNYGKSLADKGDRPQIDLGLERRRRKTNSSRNMRRNSLNLPQPVRTDLEFTLGRKDFIEVEIEA